MSKPLIFEYKDDNGAVQTITIKDVRRKTGISRMGARYRLQKAIKGLITIEQLFSNDIEKGQSANITFTDSDGTVYNTKKVMKKACINKACAYSRLKRIAEGKITREKLFAPLNFYRTSKPKNWESVSEELTPEQEKIMDELAMSPQEIELMDKYYPSTR